MSLSGWWHARLEVWREAYRHWRQPRYPIVRVDWGERVLGVEGYEARKRDCGHYSRSYAYDPVRELTLCRECDQAQSGHVMRRVR